MNNKHKRFCRVLNYIDHSLVVTSTITWMRFHFCFASLVGIPIGFAISTNRIKNLCKDCKN